MAKVTASLFLGFIPAFVLCWGCTLRVGSDPVKHGSAPPSARHSQLQAGLEEPQTGWDGISWALPSAQPQQEPSLPLGHFFLFFCCSASRTDFDLPKSSAATAGAGLSSTPLPSLAVGPCCGDTAQPARPCSTGPINQLINQYPQAGAAPSAQTQTLRGVRTRSEGPALSCSSEDLLGLFLLPQHPGGESREHQPGDKQHPKMLGGEFTTELSPSPCGFRHTRCSQTPLGSSNITGTRH